MIKKIIRIIIFPIKVTTVGLYNLCLILSKGFYFYFYLFFSFLSKITNLKVFKKIELFFKKLQYSPSSILLIIIIFIGYILFMKYGYVNNSNEIIYIDDTKDGVLIISEYIEKEKQHCVCSAVFLTGSYLSSQAASSQVLSTYKGLTTVFGMGTGGSP